MTTEGISYDAALILSSYSFDGLKHYRLSNLDRLNTSTTRVVSASSGYKYKNI